MKNDAPAFVLGTIVGFIAASVFCAMLVTGTHPGVVVGSIILVVALWSVIVGIAG